MKTSEGEVWKMGPPHNLCKVLENMDLGPDFHAKVLIFMVVSSQGIDSA